MPVGMFHVVWAVAKAIVKALCGFGIFQCAAALGSLYLEKLESLSNFRSGMRVLASVWVALCVKLPYGKAPEDVSPPATSAEKYEQLQVLELMRDLLGWLFALHRAGRTGNSGLFFEALCASAPIFPATGSNLYTDMLARYIYEVRGQLPSPVREQLAQQPGVRFRVASSVLYMDEVLEETIRFLKGATELRHVRTPEALARHLAHVQSEHTWIGEFVAACSGDRVDRETSASVTARGLDLWRLIDLLDAALASPLPSAHPLFATAAYLGDQPSRRQVLGAMAKGADRLVSTIRQLVTKTEPLNRVGTRARNVPAPVSVAKAVRPRKAGQSFQQRAQDALVRLFESGRATIRRIATSAEQRKAMLVQHGEDASPYPATLANADGTKTKKAKSSTMVTAEALAMQPPPATGTTQLPPATGTAQPPPAAASTAQPPVATTTATTTPRAFAVDCLQLLMAEAHAGGWCTVAQLFDRLVHRLEKMVPAYAVEVYLVFDRAGLVPSAKGFEQLTRTDDIADVGEDAAAARLIHALVASAAPLTATTKLNARWLASSRQLRRRVVHAIAAKLLEHPWAPTMAVTVDAETADDPAAVPVTVIGGKRRARPDLRHAFGEADAAMWHLLFIGGVGGIVLSADADGIDWGLRTLLLHAARERPEYVLQFLNANARTVSINRLLDALERGGPVKLRKKELPGMPLEWTTLQRVVAFLLIKAIGGNDYHEATVSTADAALVTWFQYASTMPALCDAHGAVDIDAVVAASLRIFYEASPMRKSGVAFPAIDLSATDGRQQLERAHALLCHEIADIYKQPAQRPPAYGQVPSLRALELSAGRARTYVNYVASIATPTEPFTGWTAPGSGFAMMDTTLLLHWDDDKDGAPVLGPAALVHTAAASKAKRALPLSANPTPSGHDVSVKRVRKAATPSTPGTVSAFARPSPDAGERAKAVAGLVDAVTAGSAAVARAPGKRLVRLTHKLLGSAL